MALFTIYSSSAGSGKTFTLTREYLRLALRHDSPHYFKHILAMTFTNDAAEEMKRRIVSALREFSADHTQKSVLLDKLLEDLHHLSEQELRKRARNMLKIVLQDYNDFAIKTIDSFVNQVISSFTFDLQLPYNYEIILNTDELITEAVRNLIDRVGDTPDLTEMFKEFALNKLDENQSWNTLEKDIVEFSKVIYRHNNAAEIAKNIGLTHRDIGEVKAKIRDTLKSMEAEVGKLATQATTLIAAHGLGSEAFLQGTRGIWNFYQKVSQDPGQLWKTGKTTQKTLDEDRWYKEKSPTAAEVEQILPTLRELTRQLLDHDNDKYHVLKAVNKNLLKIPFLAAVKKEIENILAENNSAVLADFNQKILEIVSEEPIPYIYERIGEKYHHILVDEFQDTSDMQFFNLLPLFENAIARNHENLIVGDPKQAIYSWRGGNVMLMLDLITTQKNYLEAKAPALQQERIDTLQRTTDVRNLSTNFRSGQDIIAFNNALFSAIMEGQESTVVRTVFKDFLQQPPPTPAKGGYTAIEVLSRTEDDPAEKIVARIGSILADGYRLSDICILCRRGKEGEEMAEILKKAGYPINSSEVLKVNNNLEVQFLLAALRFMLHPERQFERFEFLQFFFLIKNVEASSYDLQAVCNFSPDSFLAFFSHFGIQLEGMAGLGPYQLAEYFTAKFELMQKSAEYVLTFLDYVLAFTQRRSKNLGDLLRDWQIRKEKLAIPGKVAHAITITTIHKAKGLEYPIVILPYITWQTKPSGKDQLWLSLDDVDYPELESSNGRVRAAPFGYSHTFDFAADIQQQERELFLIENLNLLYVALTRARERQYLWIWGKKGAKGFSIEEIGQFLENFLKKQGASPPYLPLYEFGEKASTTPDQEQAPPQRVLLRLPAVFTGKAGPKIKWADAQMREGNLIHTAFERIQKISDLEPVVDTLIKEGLLAPGAEETLIQKLKAVMEHPDLAPLFSSGAVVKNEADILSSHHQIRRPDRVVFLNGQVYILDYKTGKHRPAHEKQLQEYALLLRQMGYPTILLFLVYLDPPNVVQVPQFSSRRFSSESGLRS